MDNKILEIFIPGPAGRLEAKYYISKKNIKLLHFKRNIPARHYLYFKSGCGISKIPVLIESMMRTRSLATFCFLGSIGIRK